MTSTRSFEQRHAFGDFIRAQREKVTPAAAGLPPGTRRRTPGLRREELAQLCGLSTTWFTWIEQGRDVSASPQALARLAGALELGRAARAYLFELAGKRDPDQERRDSDDMPAAVRACVEAIAAPAYILDRYWNARAWNGAAARLFVGWLDQPGERNLLRFTFGHPAARSLICDWEARGRRLTAEFRAATGTHLDDPKLRETDRRVAPRQFGVRPMLGSSRRPRARRRRADLQSPDRRLPPLPAGDVQSRQPTGPEIDHAGAARNLTRIERHISGYGNCDHRRRSGRSFYYRLGMSNNCK